MVRGSRRTFGNWPSSASAVASQVQAEELHSAGWGGQQPQQQAQRGAFAGAVRSQKAIDAGRRHFQAQLLQYRPAAEAKGQVVGFDEGRQGRHRAAGWCQVVELLQTYPPRSASF